MGILTDSINFIIPPRCLICGGRAINKDELAGWVPKQMHICGRCMSNICPHDEDRRWLLCLSEPYTDDPYPNLPLYLPYPYDTNLSRLIKLLKFNGQKEIGMFVGALLGNMMSIDKIGSDREYDMIVPIPLSASRLDERGYNQAEIIANEVSKSLGIPCVANVLQRTRDTKRQAKITEGYKRSINVSGAFALNEDWSVDGTSIILIDDVVTSGNTIHEAAMILRDAGAEFVLCAAVCGNRNQKNAESY